MNVTGLDKDGRFDPQQGGYISISDAIELAGRHAKMAHNTGLEQMDSAGELIEDAQTTDDELILLFSANRDLILNDVAISRAFTELARVKIEEERHRAWYESERRKGAPQEG